MPKNLYMVLKQLFLQNAKNHPAAGGGAPRPHSLRQLGPYTPAKDTFELQYTSLLNTSPNLDIFTF